MTGITLHAVPTKITTTADGGWRISFDVSADELNAIQMISEYRDELCQVAIVPMEAVGEIDEKTGI